MNKLGGSLIVSAVVLVAIGLTLRLDLIDWLIDALGLLFILAGVLVGIVGAFNLFAGRNKVSV